MLALLLVSANGYAPTAPLLGPSRCASVRMSAAEPMVGRRAAAFGFAAAVAAAAVPTPPALADDIDKAYKLLKDSPGDARKMLDHMLTATDMARGTPNMETTVKSTRSEMNDFVAYCARLPLAPHRRCPSRLTANTEHS